MRKYRNDPDYGDYKMEERRDFKSVATEGSSLSLADKAKFDKEMAETIKLIKGSK